MKLKTQVFALTILITTLFSCSQSKEELIVGEWIIETIDGKELPENEKMAFIILTENGICEQGTDGVCELGGDNTIKGKWELTNNDKDLLIHNNDDSENTYTQVKATSNSLSIMHDVTPITFKRKSNQ